jgi:calcineurin-like phosphoesterase family protein
MAVFFTSDTHFGHAAVIRSCERPFASADEMDEALIARWNARIKPGDTVYHLGDFCYRSDRAAPYYLDRLHGEIHLIEAITTGIRSGTTPGASRRSRLSRKSLSPGR